MASSSFASYWQDPSEPRQDDDWDILRSDLIALLDQVDAEPQQRPSGGPSARPQRALERAPDDRRQRALQSVRAAVERFAMIDEDAAEGYGTPEPDRDWGRRPAGKRAASRQAADNPGPTNPQDDLHAAIAQIRSQMGRQEHAGYARPQPDARMQRDRAAEQARRAAHAQERESERQKERERERLRVRERQAGAQLRDLAQAVGAIGGRLERLETEVKISRDAQGDIAEIGTQVAQLADVVEMLAGAVGETGQVKRLEGQIAALAKAMSDGPRADISALTHRVDEIAQTVERLTDLQVKAIGRMADGEAGTTAAHSAAMQEIEHSVRAIYDRLDTIEQRTALGPDELDRLIREVGDIASAVKSGDDARALGTLLGQVDALQERIAAFDPDRASPAIEGLRGEVVTLRAMVAESVEPRFAALESQIAALGERMIQAGDDDAGGKAGNGLAKIEGQIRQLAARMDETGAQLDRLTARKTETVPAAPAPDFEKLAAMVARRTSEEIVRTKGLENGLNEKSLDALEDRLSRLFAGAGAPRTPEVLDEVHKGIGLVEEKLAGLEAALGQSTATPGAPQSGPETETTGATAKPAASAPTPPHPGLAGQPRRKGGPAVDAMPSAPLADAPLRDPGFPPPAMPETATDEPAGLRAALAGLPPLGTGSNPASHPKPAPGASETAAPETAMSGPTGEVPAKTDPAPGASFDPETAVRPAKPRSSLAEGPAAAFVSAASAERDVRPARSRPETDSGESADRDTFIAAARRSVLRGSQDEADSGETSLFKRAAARLGRKPAQTEPQDTPRPTRARYAGSAEPALSDTPPLAADDAENAGKKDKKAGPGRLRSLLTRAGASKPEAADAETGTKGQTPDIGEVDTDRTGDRAEVRDQPSRSVVTDGEGGGFIARNKRVLFLSAGVVVVSLLTANLVLQRMRGGAVPPRAVVTSSQSAGDAVTPSTPATSTQTAPAGGDANAARNALLDPTPTGSIDPNMRIQIPGSTELAQPLPRVIGPTGAPSATATTGALSAAITDPTSTASIGAQALVPAAPSPGTPVKLALPPEKVGPLALRKAAANGDPHAQFEIAAIYTEGSIVPKDLKQAAVWYERAAAQGFAPAQYRLANLYEHGDGVGKDLEQAKLWYQRAAEAGNRMAMHNLASLLASGALGKQQFSAAAEWFARAAARGMTDSQFNLGMLYARGLGVPQDLVQSYKWFAIAAKSGDKDAAKARDDIARSLDAAQMETAKTDVDGWAIAPIDIKANFAPIGTWSPDFDPGSPITDKKVVIEVQKALAGLGYDLGTPDGLMGPKTTQAIKKFETATGMSASGVVNPRLLAVLGSQPV